MSDLTRREFLATSAWLGAGAALGFGSRVSAADTTPVVAQPVELRWLGDRTPAAPAGVAWGVPWPCSAVKKDDPISLRNAAGEGIPAQVWPLAYWPDGSIKWSGLAIAADSGTTKLMVVPGKKSTAPKSPVTVVEDENSITIHTGAVTARIDKTGGNLISSLIVDQREVARDGRLLVKREDRSRHASEGILREEIYQSKITSVVVEQSGPVRAVVHLKGLHASKGEQSREWLPFSVRFYFTAGLGSIRMVHSFVFDGDQEVDFIKGMGLAFSIPFREETQNRHVRFATDHHNVFSEPVLMAPGYRPKSMANAAEYQTAQLTGKRIPNLDQLAAKDRESIQATPTWDGFKFNQLSADAWDLTKRTNPDSSWLRITSGNRGRGLAYLGDVSGGLAIGLKNFWEKYPAAFEISQASMATGELKVWFWSPDAAAMDLRHYDKVMHSLEVTYEDPRDIKRANAYGCANTSELILWATPDTPEPPVFDAMADTVGAPPLLICAPEYYHSTRTLGIWSLPGTPMPGLSPADIASADKQLDRAFDFFNGEVERRKWYGFWDFGDYRRTYDPIRQQWMYDIGGHGWNATELMPNVWLWFAFLRSGRADIFRAAENMTRNTLEVDVHHAGPFAGLGSRHNVSHWGDGAKEVRINTGFMKRFYYCLTTDERTADLIHEPLEVAEASLARSADEFEKTAPLNRIRVGPDWLALASNWLVEWERTGDPKFRDYCLTGMQDIGALSEALLRSEHFLYDPATKHLTELPGRIWAPTQFLFIFAGDQIASELMALIPCPEFENAWKKMCANVLTAQTANKYFESRLTAYVASTADSGELREKALDLYRGLLKFKDGDYFIADPQLVDGPAVAQPALINPGNSTFTPSIATPEVSQWAINLITIPELLKNSN